MKRTAILFSGGKDSCYSAWLAKQKGYELVCLISILSENKNSYMFHTPSIKRTKQQAEVMDLPLIVQKTKGVKEEELKDLKKAIKKAKEEYGVNALVSGAIKSNYQKSRIGKICKRLKIKSLTPLWHKDEFEYLNELIKNNFEIIITGVFAEGLDKSWLGRKIDKKFIEDVKVLHKKYKINSAGEGGEFETFVLNCPLFKKGLKVVDKKIRGDGNSWLMDVGVN